MQNWRGKCRLLGVAGAANRVVIYETDGAASDDVVSEEDYWRTCLQPPLDELPFCPTSTKPGQ
jgi:hypothetical protein